MMDWPRVEPVLECAFKLFPFIRAYNVYCTYCTRVLLHACNSLTP
jgi:hypothetical protein